MNPHGFFTLLRREWMQHHRGWLWLLLVPAVVTLLALSFGHVQVGQTDKAVAVLVFGAMAYALATLTLALMALGVQAPSLARRDVQDRSIEFWLSLPVGHGSALSATLLMHAVAFPLLALGVGLLGGLLFGPLVVLRGFGWDALAAIPWGHVLALLPLAVVRLSLGLLVGLIWWAPLLLAMMAASAWLKRWGVPVLGAVVGMGGLVLDKVYHQPWLLHGVAELLELGAAAVYPGVRGFSGDAAVAVVTDDLALGWATLGHDLTAMGQDLASPWLLLAMALSALSFALLWLRRSRAA